MKFAKLFFLGSFFLILFFQIEIAQAYISRDEAKDLLGTQFIEASDQNVDAYRQSINVGMSNEQAVDNVNQASALRNSDGLPTSDTVSTNEGSWAYNGDTLLFTPNQSYSPSVNESKRNFDYTQRRAKGIEEVVDEDKLGGEDYNDAFYDFKSELNRSNLANTNVGNLMLQEYRETADPDEFMGHAKNKAEADAMNNAVAYGLFDKVEQTAKENDIDLNDIVGYSTHLQIPGGYDVKIQTKDGEIYPPPLNDNGDSSDNSASGDDGGASNGGNQSDGSGNGTSVVTGDTGGLVPCGHGSDPANRCTLCDLFVGVQRIIQWGKNILVAVALTAMVVGGIMYIVSAGNQQMMESAKNVIKQALVGVIIVLGAWLIINTVMWLIVVKNDMGVGAGGSWYNFSCGGGGTVNTDVLNNSVNNAFDNMLNGSINNTNNTSSGQNSGLPSSVSTSTSQPASTQNTPPSNTNPSSTPPSTQDSCPVGQHSVNIIDIQGNLTPTCVSD